MWDYKCMVRVTASLSSLRKNCIIIKPPLHQVYEILIDMELMTIFKLEDILNLWIMIISVHI